MEQRSIDESPEKGGILKRRIRPNVKSEKQERIRLVDQHYRIDKQSRSLLPGVKSHDKDLARDIHDFFNLIILVSPYSSISEATISDELKPNFVFF